MEEEAVEVEVAFEVAFDAGVGVEAGVAEAEAQAQAAAATSRAAAAAVPERERRRLPGRERGGGDIPGTGPSYPPPVVVGGGASLVDYGTDPKARNPPFRLRRCARREKEDTAGQGGSFVLGGSCV